MIAWLLIAVIVLILPPLGLLPLKVTGKASRNKITHVIMHPLSWYDARSYPYQAVFAQEAVEWWLRLLGALVVSAPLCWLIGFGTTYLHIIGGLLAIVVSTLWQKIPPLWRWFEYVGHAAELSIATGRDYRLQELSRMQRAYDGRFKHLTIEELGAKVDRQKPLARLLIRALWLRIKREAL